MMFQDLCRAKMGWDDDLPEDKLRQWQRWCTDLKNLQEFSIPRCIKPEDFGVIADCTLHHFSDASERGFGSASYVRLENQEGQVHCALVMAKGKLAPIKVTTIPRLELTAACESIKLDRILRKELEIPINNSVFWTDSMIVLHYIKNETRRFQTFVANRVAKIHEGSSPTQWRHVDTENNPADDVSRGLMADELIANTRWNDGPGFLQKPDEEWPQTPAQLPPSDQLEEKPEHQVYATDQASTCPDIITRLIDRHSGWYKLKRSVAYILILPKKHHVTDLVVRQYHAVTGHSGCERVLTEIRQKYWIPKGRIAVRRIITRCFPCSKRNAKPLTQQMADLPPDRVNQAKGPFCFTGVDYFGPFQVKRARSTVKRYGCLFTCLSTRAIHIEIAASLTTDSFINALVRFTSRRGHPELIRSDNGTNFVGAQKELKQAIKEWNQQKIEDFLHQKEIRWTFNPPAASNMGGVWERQIKTVRKVLNGVVKEQIMDDEGISTLMCQVEAIINGRPITRLSDDPNDLEPLTPNYLLLFRSGPTLPPGLFGKADKYSKRRWKQVQYLANVFWRRWSREYLTGLQERQKWTAEVRNIRTGDLVLIVDDNAPRNTWQLGRVIEVYPGKDGLIRSGKIRTQHTQLVRPVNKLCLIEPVEDTSSAL
ncbi:uncharacterized protein LOC135500166 [Lineus longissimus]|uniref:uncharacterized protein LOC135500166 n=1 Tax=Lineus longissimus TaxID=88925 RepID=UPI00315DCC33